MLRQILLSIPLALTHLVLVGAKDNPMITMLTIEETADDRTVTTKTFSAEVYIKGRTRYLRAIEEKAADNIQVNIEYDTLKANRKTYRDGCQLSASCIDPSSNDQLLLLCLLHSSRGKASLSNCALPHEFTVVSKRNCKEEELKTEPIPSKSTQFTTLGRHGVPITRVATVSTAQWFGKTLRLTRIGEKTSIARVDCNYLRSPNVPFEGGCQAELACDGGTIRCRFWNPYKNQNTISRCGNKALDELPYCNETLQPATDAYLKPAVYFVNIVFYLECADSRRGRLYIQDEKWWLAKDEEHIPEISRYPLCVNLPNSKDIFTQTIRCQVAINCNTVDGDIYWYCGLADGQQVVGCQTAPFDTITYCRWQL